MENSNYLDFLERSLPNYEYGSLIDSDELIKQFDFTQNGRYVTSQGIEYLSQGDIFSDLNAMITDQMTKNVMLKTVDGILLSNTCDAERREFLSFAPLILIKEIAGIELKEVTVRKNEKNSLLYLPHNELQEYVIDLNQIFTISREHVLKLQQAGKIKKKYSLKEAGYYLLITKLVVLFCRTESEDVKRLI